MTTIDPFANFVVGYPKLAARSEVLPEIAIYRRFGALNALDLLYYQAELTDLEEQLQSQQKIDENGQNVHGARYARNWQWLKHSKADGGDGVQFELVMEIRKLLKQYNKALIHQATILGYKEPGKWDLHYLQDYLQSDEMGNLALRGRDATIWGRQNERDSHKQDLIALKPRAKKDAFSVWAAENTVLNLIRCGCARFMTPSRIHGSIGYEDSTIYRITYWFTNILASLIPIGSIVVLYQVESMSARLGIIAAFNVLLSICLMCLTNAKRAEFFAIMAAFAAVQVVFVSTDRSAASPPAGTAQTVTSAHAVLQA